MSESDDSILSRWSKPLADAARKLAADKGVAPKVKPDARKQIAVVRAVVEFPVYEGEQLDRDWNEFSYDEQGKRRPCKTISSRVIRVPDEL